MSIIKKFLWLLVAGLVALAFGMIATSRGEPLNAVWLVAAEGGNPVSRREFYDDRQQEKYSRPNRCC